MHQIPNTSVLLRRRWEYSRDETANIAEVKVERVIKRLRVDTGTANRPERIYGSLPRRGELVLESQ